MPLSRPKIPAIYDKILNWWNNDGGVFYIAHAITVVNGTPTATELRPSVSSGSGGGTKQHPDQQYWQKSVTKVANTVRIEIDCTLMPCDGEYDGCLFRVPMLIREWGYTGVPLRIFSHRDEGKSGGGSSKRYITCNSSDNNALLKTAMANQDGWGWAPYTPGVYP